MALTPLAELEDFQLGDTDGERVAALVPDSGAQIPAGAVSSLGGARRPLERWACLRAAPSRPRHRWSGTPNSARRHGCTAVTWPGQPLRAQRTASWPGWRPRHARRLCMAESRREHRCGPGLGRSGQRRVGRQSAPLRQHHEPQLHADGCCLRRGAQQRRRHLLDAGVRDTEIGGTRHPGNGSWTRRVGRESDVRQPRA